MDMSLQGLAQAAASWRPLGANLFRYGSWDGSLSGAELSALLIQTTFPHGSLITAEQRSAADISQEEKDEREKLPLSELKGQNRNCAERR